jgi:hypothetical protein
VILALAGRRIDAPDAPDQRFPLQCVPLVRERLRTALRELGAQALVCAAACGADLIALSVAEELGVRRHIVLPSAVADFRAHSVADRPGDWNGLFDRLIVEARSTGDLELLDLRVTGSAAYLQTNVAILDRASTMARDTAGAMAALAVWDGALTGRTDYTQDFVEAARRRGISVRTIGIRKDDLA